MTDNQNSNDPQPDQPPVPHQLKPVTGANRIASIDVLRGAAVLGILAMNIYAFAMPGPAYANPLIWGGNDFLSRGVWFFTHIVFDQKFMTIFSMLFGAGLILMFNRSDDGKFAGVWYRRNLWLLVFGALHGYFLWFGDILFNYALMGLLIYPLRRKKPKTLITLGIIWMLIALPISTAAGFWMQSLQKQTQTIELKKEAGENITETETKILEQWENMRPMAAPTSEDINKEIKAHLGSYGEAMKHRAPMVFMMQTMGVLFFIFWRVGGLMLIGMGFMKLGIFSAGKDNRFYWRLLIWGYGLGLPLVIISGWQLAAHQWDFLYVQQIGGYWNYFASICMSLGHIALVMLAVKNQWLTILIHRLAAVGRMAFTNYLMQTIICTTLFYGYGLAVYGTLNRGPLMLVVLGIWLLQLSYSSWWLHRFRFGPAEWLWRHLTYGKLPKFRREEN